MSDQEFVDELLELSTEFGKLVATDEALAAKIPPGAIIVFQVNGHATFNQRAKTMAQERHQREPAVPVLMVHVEGLSPPTSRLINPHLEVASAL